jgi:hypothetical protein
MLSAGAQIGVNAASSVIGGAIGLANTALQHKYNKKLATYQNDINIQNWNMQNEYNTPAAQRKRLEEAGLNPAQMYGGGSTSAGNAQSLPAYQQAGVDIGQNMLSGMQMAQMAANIRNTNADAKGKEIENQYKDEYWRQSIGSLIDDRNIKQVNYKQFLADYENRELKYDALRVQIDQARATVNNIDEDTLNKRQQRRNMEIQEALDTFNLIVLKPREAKIADYQADSLKADIAVKTATEAKIKADTVYEEWRNQFIKDNGYEPSAAASQVILQLIGRAAQESDAGGVTGVFKGVKEGFKRNEWDLGKIKERKLKEAEEKKKK